MYISRTVTNIIQSSIDRNKSVLLLGPRQTGKSTLAERLKPDLTVQMILPATRIRYEKNPDLLRGEVEALRSAHAGRRPLVFLDEVQKTPEIMDVVQYLIDKGSANFLLTGSSARKLTRGGDINLLPGRVVALRLDPLTILEAPPRTIEDALNYGALPGIIQTTVPADRETDLKSYVTTYLDEEIRAEALVRKVGVFARFLECAASESGRVVNFFKISQDVGVSHTTIQAYFRILEDCLIAERVDPIHQSATRKKLTKSSKYLFFDLGVRRVAAGEGLNPPKDALGHWFEQWVGLELIRLARLQSRATRIRFWRDPAGPEVDWVVEREGELIPVEVKWTDAPSSTDTKNLTLFLKEHPAAAQGFVICRTPRRAVLSPRITAIPWQEIGDVFAAPPRGGHGSEGTRPGLTDLG